MISADFPSRIEIDSSVIETIAVGIVKRQKRYLSYKERVILEQSQRQYAAILRPIEDGHIYLLGDALPVNPEVGQRITELDSRKIMQAGDELNLDIRIESKYRLLVEKVLNTVVSPDPIKLEVLKRLPDLPKEVRKWLKQLK